MWLVKYRSATLYDITNPPRKEMMAKYEMDFNF